MALLRCPNCHAKGEVIGEDPERRVRCAVCGHGFVAGDADATREYNILSEDSPIFPAEARPEPTDWAIAPRWRRWVERLAAHCALEPEQALRQALAEFARARGFTAPPPRD